ncbi:magnesium transporter, partial [Candidatus Saccharibacteria bacterium]|nr:magnesium transporter [Candidatus Saccharibacteria bacterium]
IALFSQSHTTQQAILARLSNAEIINLLNSLDPDHATALIRQLPKLRGSRITSQLSHQIREKVDFLLRFHPKTAAGMMDIDYVIVSPEDTFDTVAKAIRRHDLSTGRPPIVLCVDTGGVLLGELPAHILALKPKTTKVAGWCRKLPNVRFDDDEQKVVNTFVRNPHHKVVVLDDNDSVLGIVHSDDVLAVLDKRTLRDLSSFAGVKNEEDAMDSAITKFRNRWIWLLINLGTAFLAASVVGLFESTISKFTLLAVYMPIVAGMGGNAGTQTMAIAVRGIVLREVELGHGWTFIRREMMAGLMNGILNGLIVASVATFFNRSPILGLVLAIAMVVNLMIAGMFGALIPLIMKTLGKDPAASATIFITTCTDVGGFFVFLSLAKMLL